MTTILLILLGIIPISVIILLLITLFQIIFWFLQAEEFEFENLLANKFFKKTIVWGTLSQEDIRCYWPGKEPNASEPIIVLFTIVSVVLLSLIVIATAIFLTTDNTSLYPFIIFSTLYNIFILIYLIRGRAVKRKLFNNAIGAE